jgi:MYXO-CTERM domain-containing protein
MTHRFWGLAVVPFLVAAGCVDDRAPGKAPEALLQSAPRVEIARAESSRPLSELAKLEWDEAPEYDHELHRIRRAPGFATPRHADAALQSEAPKLSMPAKVLDFIGQGHNNGAVGGDPPDTVGAVGPNHYVQTVNSHVEVWDKTGSALGATAPTNSLFSGYTGTNAGNGCATRNDGDAVVLYDTLADRWFITQFSLPNSSAMGGPSFQCVAVSKTGDPTGAYWLYDFKYAVSVDDYGKFGVWPDAYYATFNQFDGTDYKGSDFCAYDRTSMLAGQTATQQCFLQAAPSNPPACPAAQPFSVFGALPATLDGLVKPPNGTPGVFLQFDYSACTGPYNQLDLWTLHVDWATPANTKLTGPKVLTVSNFTPTCNGAAPNSQCVPQPTTVQLDGLDDRLMFRLNYRNFGTHESLLVNHSVVAGATSGVRWYEIRSPAGAAPTIFQQGTYAPADSSWRWMGSIAQDMARGMVLGFSASSTTMNPTIGWTGRLASDGAGTMGQGESLLDTGTGTQGDDYAPDLRGRWGDYSSMTVDPTDDCTFWYTTEIVNKTGTGFWDTRVATVKYPSCGANDFTIALTPPTQTLAKGANVTYTVTTTLKKGAAESMQLFVQDLPAGVTGAFVPATVTAGGTSTLTLTATAGAPDSSAAFTVIGTATSAVHPASAKVTVGQCVPAPCPSGKNCGTLPDGCGGMSTCGTCTSPSTCGGGGTPNVCGCAPLAKCPAPANCGTMSNGCGGTVACGSCSGADVCVNNICGPAPDDGGADSGPAGDDSGAPPGDSGAPSSDGGSDDGGGGGGGGGGCSCRTTASANDAPWPLGLVVLAVLRRRRRRT